MLKRTGMDRWQRALALGLALLFSLGMLSGCGGDEDEPQAESDAPEATPEETILMPVQSAAVNTPAPSTAPLQLAEPQLEVTQTVAYYFPETKQLYGAVEFENTGTTTLYIEEVAFTFNTGARSVEAEFTPMLNTDDYVVPGQKATLAYWRSYDREEELTFDSPIQLEEVTLTPANRAVDAADYKLTVQDCVVIQNYPGFSTLTGNVINEIAERDYALSLIYASFYDEGGQLIGVWHFTKNMTIRAESKRNFSVHLEALPIPDLEEKTAEIVGRGVGIE